LPNVLVKKVASGADHIALLTDGGVIYSLGNSEQGQLGRVPEMFAHRGGRRGEAIAFFPFSDPVLQNRDKTSWLPDPNIFSSGMRIRPFFHPKSYIKRGMTNKNYLFLAVKVSRSKL
jgi:hypothetical protein